MRTIALAFRNLIRNKRRSLATVAATALGVTAVLLFGGYVDSIQYGLETGYVQDEGHFQIVKQGYFDFGTANPGQYGIERYQEVVDLLKNDKVLAPMLAVVSPSLSLTGLGGNSDAGVSRTIVADGQVVSDINSMHKWNDYDFALKNKDSQLTGTSSDSIYIGQGVARVLMLCDKLRVANCPKPPIDTGDVAAKAIPADISALTASRQDAKGAQRSDLAQMELLTSSGRGAPNVAELKVVKAVNMGVKDLDDMYVGMHLSQAQKLVYGAAPPRATAIMLQLHHSSDMDAVRTRVEKLLNTTLKGNGLEIRDFKEISPSYGQTVGLFTAVFTFIFILIAAIVLFLVGNTMGTSVVERTIEIGTLRSMGVKRRGIKWMFVCEGIQLGALGAATGIVLALAIAWIVNQCSLTWTPPGATDAVPLTIRIWGDSGLILSTFIDLLIIAAFSAWFPARRAARLNIVDSLRHV
jgi:putative ABC transport system permease protein